MALNNQGLGFSTYWAPVVNLARSPKWGRNLETPGEDKYLSGQYAAAFVGGMQESELDPAHWQAGATCKHFVANSMENTTEVGVTRDRHSFDARVTMQDLVSDYMVPFQSCVEEARGCCQPARELAPMCSLIYAVWCESECALSRTRRMCRAGAGFGAHVQLQCAQRSALCVQADK